MRFSICCYALLASLVVLAAAPLNAADNWPQWRGPDGNGVGAEGDYPVKFSGEEGVAWKVELPGPGSSPPAVWGDQVFVTCAIDDQDSVVCYDMEGQEQWRKSLGPARPGKNRNGSGSNPSPVTDGEHVVVYFKSGRVACLDTGGEEQWQTNLQQKYGKDTLWWDLGTSPVLAGERVVIAVMQEGDSYLVALDLATGDEAWKTKRQYERPEESDQAYTTPQLAKLDGRDVVVTWGADHLTGHDAATGEQLWVCAGFNPKDEPMWRVIASHAMGDGVAVVPFGRGKFLAGIRLGGEGDITASSRLWEQQGVAGDVPTPVVDGKRVYVITDAGDVTCLDLQSGDEHWSDKLPRSKDKFYASPIVAGGKLFCVHEGGKLFVASVGDRFELLAENDMGERVIATPVPVRGGLLIRGEKHLMRIDGESEPQPAG